jgi:hypothetical protein
MNPPKGTDEMNPEALRNLTADDLAREVAHARNQRDAFAEGRVPGGVLANLRALLDEQARRRHARKLAANDALLAKWTVPNADGTFDVWGFGGVKVGERVGLDDAVTMARRLDLRGQR